MTQEIKTPKNEQARPPVRTPAACYAQVKRPLWGFPVTTTTGEKSAVWVGDQIEILSREGRRLLCKVTHRRGTFTSRIHRNNLTRTSA